MMPPFAVRERREREFAAAATQADVARLQRQWEVEDRQRERAAAPQATEPLLARRVAQLEQQVGRLQRDVAKMPDTEGLADVIGKAMADALHERMSPAAVREAVGVAVSRLYAGTWEPTKSYPSGTLATCSGSLWIAMSSNINERPGSGSSWKLAAKGGQSRKGERP